MSLNVHIKILKRFNIKRFYVYVHITQDTNELFYVGKGTRDRFLTKNNRNRFYNAIIKKHPIMHKIIYVTYDESDAFEKEKEFIEKYHTCVFDENKMRLASNISKGGEGVSGTIQSKEHVLKRTQKLIGQKRDEAFKIKMHNVSIGKKKSKEHCEHIKTARQKQQPTFKDKRHSQKSKELIKQKRKLQIRTNNKLISLISLNDEVFNFDSFAKTAEFLSQRTGFANVTVAIKLRKCLKKQLDNAYNFKCIYQKDLKNDNNK